MKKCPRAGARVRFEGNPASIALYSDRARPTPGATGVVTSIPVPGGKKTCLPGPGGGLVYVKWDDGRVFGVAPGDLKKAKGGGRLAGTGREHVEPGKPGTSWPVVTVPKDLRAGTHVTIWAMTEPTEAVVTSSTVQHLTVGGGLRTMPHVSIRTKTNPGSVIGLQHVTFDGGAGGRANGRGLSGLGKPGVPPPVPADARRVHELETPDVLYRVLSNRAGSEWWLVAQYFDGQGQEVLGHSKSRARANRWTYSLRMGMEPSRLAGAFTEDETNDLHTLWMPRPGGSEPEGTEYRVTKAKRRNEWWLVARDYAGGEWSPLRTLATTTSRATANEWLRVTLTGNVPAVLSGLGAPRQSKAEKALDKEIERIYYAHAQGVQVNIMDIGKVFAAGRAAAASGGDVEAAVVEAIKRYRAGGAQVSGLGAASEPSGPGVVVKAELRKGDRTYRVETVPSEAHGWLMLRKDSDWAWYWTVLDYLANAHEVQHWVDSLNAGEEPIDTVDADGTEHRFDGPPIAHKATAEFYADSIASAAKKTEEALGRGACSEALARLLKTQANYSHVLSHVKSANESEVIRDIPERAVLERAVAAFKEKCVRAAPGLAGFIRPRGLPPPAEPPGGYEGMDKLWCVKKCKRDHGAKSLTDAVVGCIDRCTGAA